MKDRDDFDKEVRNLHVLKGSLTIHKNIMLHLATITHGQKNYILLPYAELGDLELLLHCGVDFDGQQTYKFEEKFKAFANNNSTFNLPFALFRQLCLLADALRWLHTGIRTDRDAVKIYFAHMDLKPSNILVEHDCESPVGRWMLSDFGISAYKEEQTSLKVNPGNHFSKMTMNTKPRRHEGTYQAPEVRSLGTTSTVDEREVGRKSDIWSFGCMLCEVLVFALGKVRLVKEFERVRREKRDDDYFYEGKTPVGGAYLSAGPPAEEYQVRDSITKWLECLPKKYDNHLRWIDCCVGTIQKLLDVSAKARPNADRLVEMAEHLQSHSSAPATGHNRDCAILNPGIVRSPIAPSEVGGAVPSVGFDPPALYRTDTSGTELILPKDLPWRTSLARSSMSFDLRRKAQPPLSSDLPKQKSVTDVALASTGNRIVYLVNTSAGPQAHIFNISLIKKSFSEPTIINLPLDKGWKRIALAEEYLVAWGHSSARAEKLVRSWLGVKFL
jgi:serine/threonine protein kinase